MKNIYFLLIISLLIVSCGEKKSGELQEIPVDTGLASASLPLSAFTDEITAIELELTDESLITPSQIIRVLFTEDQVIVGERGKIFVFGRDGKFIRTIGSKGQGPGEFINIRNLALDEKNKRLFVISSPKVICYDLDGNFLKESSPGRQNGMNVIDLNYVNGELLVLGERMGQAKNSFNHSALYRLNDALQITDSCSIRDVYFGSPGFYIHPFENFIVYGNASIQLYYSDIYHDMQNPTEVVLRDTLYYFEKNRLIPELKLKFKNDGVLNGSKYINLMNVYQSSRYVFAYYFNIQDNTFHNFYYDTKTKEGCHVKDGYTDDINGIETPVKIRPLVTNTEFFYYWYTHIDDEDSEEPNPTVYIGKLKK